MSDQRIFVDEGVLDINYVPPKLLHRDEELRLMRLLFDYMLTAPYEMSQRAIIVGGVGSGKTALAQIFGRWLRDEAKKRRVKALFIHVNCRELRGSLFMVLRRVVKTLKPDFPDRGYAANELMETLMQLLDEENTQLLLALDEVDSLVNTEGENALYELTRTQEGRPDAPRRLSLLCITKDPTVFNRLDPSTRSSLQRNMIELKPYGLPQIAGIVMSRSDVAFRRGAIPVEVIDFIAELALQERSDARYAIDLLWRAGKYAELENSKQVNPDHVRRAAPSVFATLKEESLGQLSRHEQLVLLAIARFFKRSAQPHASTGEIEQMYRIICEEHKEEPRAHTQFWKYLNNLKNIDAVQIKLDASSQGRTQLISLTKITANDLEKEVQRSIEQK